MAQIIIGPLELDPAVKELLEQFSASREKIRQEIARTLGVPPNALLRRTDETDPDLERLLDVLKRRNKNNDRVF